MTEKITTYKGMSKDMTAHGGFQYELGKTYTDDSAIRCKSKGFHSCDAPMDVLRYFPIRDGNRYFVCEAAGIIDRTDAKDTKLASSELTVKGEIGLPDIVKAQIEYTRRKAEDGQAGGHWSKLAGGDWSNIAGGNQSNLAGGDWSNIAGGNQSNLAGGNRSNLAGGNQSNIAGGNQSNLAGGNQSNLAGGNRSNIAGGNWSLIIGRNGCKAKAGINSVIVLTEWQWVGDEYKPIAVKAVIVDGEIIKADTWYKLENGELVEVDE